MGRALLFFSTFTRKLRPERLSNLPKITELLSGSLDSKSGSQMPEPVLLTFHYAASGSLRNKILCEEPNMALSTQLGHNTRQVVLVLLT